MRWHGSRFDCRQSHQRRAARPGTLLKNTCQLIAYPNRIGAGLGDLRFALDNYFHTAVGGVHVLPPFPSNADGGFSPISHREIDPAYGTWTDLEAIAAAYDLCLDITLNHISDASPEFQDFLARGRSSEYAGLFVRLSELPDIGPDDLAKIHIRKEKVPFREVQFGDGTVDRVWCTFTENQIDLDYTSEDTYRFVGDIIAFLAARGVKLFRLDAFGYTTKRVGTSCFLVEPDVYQILDWANGVAKSHGAEILPEVHDHPSYQSAIGQRDMRPYAFALPPLVLYSLLDANSRYLKNWLRTCPRNQITVLDTHDGICIPDVEDLLPAERVQDLVDNVIQRSADPIMRGSAASVHSVGAIYQLTCTFYDALKRNDDAYVCARAIQLFTPGIPQVYYVGLLCGTNDEALCEKTGEPRDINRHYFTLPEVEERLATPTVKRLLRLMSFRNSYPAFDGEFELHYSNDASLVVAWRNGEAWCELFCDLMFKRATIDYFDLDTRRRLSMRC